MSEVSEWWCKCGDCGVGGSDVDGPGATGGTLGDLSTVCKEKFMNDNVHSVSQYIFIRFMNFEKIRQIEVRAKM